MRRATDKPKGKLEHRVRKLVAALIGDDPPDSPWAESAGYIVEAIVRAVVFKGRRTGMQRSDRAVGAIDLDGLIRIQGGRKRNAAYKRERNR